MAQDITVKDRSNLQALKGVKVNQTETNSAGIVSAETAKLQGLNKIVFRLDGYQTDSMSWDQLKAQGYVVYLSEASFDLNGHVVSASRFQESAKDVAQLTAVIDQKRNRERQGIGALPPKPPPAQNPNQCRS